MKKEKVNIIVVDDHSLFRSGIVALLSNAGSVNVVGEASDGYAALTLLNKKKTDLLLLDLNMPGLNGLETCHEVIKQYPDMNILILSWHCKAVQVIDLLESGAKGFLSKNCSKEELLTAIHAMNQGGSYFSQPMSEILLELKAQKRSGSIQRDAKRRLTEREQQVLECIANEYTNKEIATQLFISQRTVETHRRNLIQKLQVKNTVGLVKYYFSTINSLNQTLRINT